MRDRARQSGPAVDELPDGTGISLLDLGELDDALALLPGEVSPAKPFEDLLVRPADLGSRRPAELGLYLGDGCLGVGSEKGARVPGKTLGRSLGVADG